MKRNETGFTLVELAVAIVIGSIFAAGAMFLYDRAERQRRLDVTERNMNLVMKALATYADSAGRLPCPADPSVPGALFGWEWGVQAATIASGRPIPDSDANPATRATCQRWGDAGAAAPNDDPARNIGIVPFLTLGLDPEEVKDSWGRYFTYAVSPVFAQNNDDINPNAARGSAAADDTGTVHMRCLDSAWIDTNDNVSATKAKFCCAKGGDLPPFDNSVLASADIVIQDAAGNPVWPNGLNAEFYDNDRGVPTYALKGGQTGYDAVDPAGADTEPYVYTGNVAAGVDAGSSVQNPNFATAPAFVLISHGENGDGAYFSNNNRAKYVSGTAVGAGEQENGAGANANAFDNIFVIGQRSDPQDPTHFDDIVVWRTQDGIMAETGASSCAYP